MITIAACQYEIEVLSDWKSYAAKIESLTVAAKQQNAQLLMLPEYAGIEIGCGKYISDHELYRCLQPLIPNYINFYKNLAQQHQLYILAGTILEKDATDHYANRAYFFGPNGNYGFQDKLQLTAYEKQSSLIAQGKKQTVFETSLGKIGIAICYDSEFPEIIRNLTKAGATLILVPSYTSTIAGYYRVFLSSRARAIENQCYVALSYVVNAVEVSGETEQTYGRIAILGPVDNNFPDDGIIAQAADMDQANLLTASVSLEKLFQIRKNGQVHNFEDAMRHRLISNMAMQPL